MYIQIIKIDKTYLLTSATSELARIGYNDLYSKINISNEESYKYLYKFLNDIPDKKLILDGVKDFKKEEISYLADKKLGEYLNTKKCNKNYYDLQEKAILLYKLSGKSSVLSQIADKKNIAVDDLVKSIEKKIDEHYNVIFNFKHSVDDFKREIDQTELDDLYDLNLNDYLEQVLYKKNRELIDNFETISVETISVEKKLNEQLEDSKLATDSDQLVDQLADDINEKKKGKLRLFKK